MNYLLDTCVICEMMKKRPDEKVVKWLVLARNDLDLGPRDGFHEPGLKAPDSVGIMYR